MDITLMFKMTTNIQLMKFSEESLRRDLYHSNSHISTEPVVVILMILWHVAVQDENMLCEAILQNMHLNRDEGIRNSTAKQIFGISCPCECNTLQMEQMVSDVVIHDLEDPEIRQDILSHENQDLTLETPLSQKILRGKDHTNTVSMYKKG